MTSFRGWRTFHDISHVGDLARGRLEHLCGNGSGVSGEAIAADRSVPAGGPSDALGRAVAQAMAAHLKQSVIVENIGGASGTIGLTKLLKAPADGYSLGFGTIGTHVANVALFKRLPYDRVADFEPVGLVANDAGIS